MKKEITITARARKGVNLKTEFYNQYNMTMALYEKLNIKYKGAKLIEKGKEVKLFFEVDN